MNHLKDRQNILPIPRTDATIESQGGLSGLRHPRAERRAGSLAVATLVEMIVTSKKDRSMNTALLNRNDPRY
jgi:hypothetical protein